MQVFHNHLPMGSILLIHVPLVSQLQTRSVVHRPHDRVYLGLDGNVCVCATIYRAWPDGIAEMHQATLAATDLSAVHGPPHRKLLLTTMGWNRGTAGIITSYQAILKRGLHISHPCCGPSILWPPHTRTKQTPAPAHKCLVSLRPSQRQRFPQT